MADEIITSTSAFIGKLPYRPDFNADKYKVAIPETETTVVWGRAGASPFQENFATSLEAQEEREVRRKFDVIRVKDPDNEENHVDLEVMTEWEARTKIGNKRVVMRLEKPTSSANVEILERNKERTSST